MCEKSEINTYCFSATVRKASMSVTEKASCSQSGGWRRGWWPNLLARDPHWAKSQTSHTHAHITEGRLIEVQQGHCPGTASEKPEVGSPRGLAQGNTARHRTRPRLPFGSLHSLSDLAFRDLRGPAAGRKGGRITRFIPFFLGGGGAGLILQKSGTIARLFPAAVIPLKAK